MKGKKDVIRGQKFIFVLFVLLGFPLAVVAQSYTVGWYTIDGGGGTSSGNGYVLSGTIGQPDVGVMKGGPYHLSGGFWSRPACVVDMDDLLAFVADWLDDTDPPANLDGLGDVDLYDYSIIASYWLNYCPDNWPLP